MAFLMLRIDEPAYKEEEFETGVIIPIRLGLFTRRQMEAMTNEEIEVLASDHPSWDKRFKDDDDGGILGVYFRKARKP